MIRVWLDALGEDFEEIEEDFDHEVETDETEEIEQIEKLSQNLNEVLSQEANNEVFWNLFIWFKLFYSQFSKKSLKIAMIKFELYMVKTYHSTEIRWKTELGHDYTN